MTDESNEGATPKLETIKVNDSLFDQATIVVATDGLRRVILSNSYPFEAVKSPEQSVTIDEETLRSIEELFGETFVTSALETGRKWANGETDTNDKINYALVPGDEGYLKRDKAITQCETVASRIAYLIEKNPANFNVLPGHVKAAVKLCDALFLLTSNGTAHSFMEVSIGSGHYAYPREDMDRMVGRYIEIMQEEISKASEDFPVSIDRERLAAEGVSIINMINGNAVYVADRLHQQQTGVTLSKDKGEIKCVANHRFIGELCDELERLRPSSKSA